MVICIGIQLLTMKMQEGSNLSLPMGGQSSTGDSNPLVCYCVCGLTKGLHVRMNVATIQYIIDDEGSHDIT